MLISDLKYILNYCSLVALEVEDYIAAPGLDVKIHNPCNDLYYWVGLDSSPILKHSFGVDYMYYSLLVVLKALLD